jgi:hypothetical protein
MKRKRDCDDNKSTYLTAAKNPREIISSHPLMFRLQKYKNLMYQMN